MNRLLMVLIYVLFLSANSWAQGAASPPEAPSEELKVEDLPKPVVELLTQLQRLSREIEPHITQLGSKLGQELDRTVKQLTHELQSQRQRPPE